MADRLGLAYPALFQVLMIGVWALAPALITPSEAQTELKATGSAIACLAPEKLPSAEDAVRKHDRAQMDVLGCFPVVTGTPAKRIDDGKQGLLHVVLDPNGADPTEVWARQSSFR